MAEKSCSCGLKEEERKNKKQTRSSKMSSSPPSSDSAVLMFSLLSIRRLQLLLPLPLAWEDGRPTERKTTSTRNMGENEVGARRVHTVLYIYI